MYVEGTNISTSTLCLPSCTLHQKKSPNLSDMTFYVIVVFCLYRVLQHPNILQCLGQCVEAVPFLLVFEYCEMVRKHLLELMLFTLQGQLIVFEDST